ncbi:MAG: fused MFS/spermidine synthase [Flavobacteriales bacterium]|nr:fused MFS/spermidine synthase [Flavobacteriales bacterium]
MFRLGSFILISIAFIEGFTVMAVELVAGKMMTSLFGSSTIVWVIVLSVILMCLSIGYFAGARLSEKLFVKNLALILLMLGAISVLWISYYKIDQFYYASSTALLFSCLVEVLKIVLPSMILLGAISPLIIKELHKEDMKAGKVAGSIYLVSTLGGVVSTFLFGFYFIPEFGLLTPMIWLSVGLIAFSFTLLLMQKSAFTALAIVPIVIYFDRNENIDTINNSIVKERLSGVLGEIIVIEENIDSTKVLKVYTNKTNQTQISTVEGKEPQYDQYVNKIGQVIASKEKAKDILLLGLGGGAIVKVIENDLRSITAIEFDQRMINISQRYFGVSEHVKLINDDARHHLNILDETFDVIVFDVFKGEVNPSHIITIESMMKIRNNLNADGILIVNGNGFIEGEFGSANRSIIETLRGSGFRVTFASNGIKENGGNLIIVAQSTYDSPEDYLGVLNSHGFQECNVLTSQDAIITDDNLLMEYLNQEANLTWRRGYLNTTIEYFEDNRIPLLK